MVGRSQCVQRGGTLIRLCGLQLAGLHVLQHLHGIYSVCAACRMCARLCKSSCQPAAQSHNTNNNTLMMSLKTRSQCAEFWSKRVREEYREANDGDEVSVQINDVGKRSPGLLHQCRELLDSFSSCISFTFSLCSARCGDGAADHVPVPHLRGMHLCGVVCVDATLIRSFLSIRAARGSTRVMGVHSHLLVHHCGRGGVGRPRLLAMGQEYLHSFRLAAVVLFREHCLSHKCDGVVSFVVDPGPGLRQGGHHRDQVLTAGLHQLQIAIDWCACLTDTFPMKIHVRLGDHMRISSSSGS